MKRFLHTLSGLVLFLLLVATGALMIYCTLSGPGMWEKVLNILGGERLRVFCCGIALLLILLLYVITARRSNRRVEQFLTFENDEGSVSISMKAVKEFLTRLQGEYAALIQMTPTVIPRANHVDIVLDVKVRSGSHVPELCQSLQSRVRQSLSDNLGLTDVHEVKVNVCEIVGQPTKTASEDEPAEQSSLPSP